MRQHLQLEAEARDRTVGVVTRVYGVVPEEAGLGAEPMHRVGESGPTFMQLQLEQMLRPRTM